MVPGAAHLGHGGEAELVEVLQDVMVKVRRDSPQAGNIQSLVTAGQLNQAEGGCERGDSFYNEGDLECQTSSYQHHQAKSAGLCLGHPMTIYLYTYV